MNALRILTFSIGLILMIPMIAASVWGFNMSAWVNAEVERNDAILNEEQVIPEPTPMPGNPISWLRERADLRDKFSMTDLTSDRIVVITQIITPEELLQSGEASPDPAFLDLYAAARAPARLVQYCTDVISAIGTACDIIHSEVRENHIGKFELTGHLAFIPAAEMGDPSEVDDGELVRGMIELPHAGDLRPANDVSSRTAAMQQAQSMCDMLRTEFGNCVLTNVRFDIEELWITDLEVLPSGTNPQRLRTSATFQVYANPRALDRERLQSRLRQMAGQS